MNPAQVVIGLDNNFSECILIGQVLRTTLRLVLMHSAIDVFCQFVCLAESRNNLSDIHFQYGFDESSGFQQTLYAHS